MINSKRNNPTLNRKTRKSIERWQKQCTNYNVPLNRDHRPIATNTLLFSSVQAAERFVLNQIVSANDFLIIEDKVCLKYVTIDYGLNQLFTTDWISLGTVDAHKARSESNIIGIFMFDGRITKLLPSESDFCKVHTPLTVADDILNSLLDERSIRVLAEKSYALWSNLPIGFKI